MSESNYITDKVQRAAAAYLQGLTLSSFTSDQIHYGIRSGSNAIPQNPTTLPCVICVCQDADVEDPDGPNWKCRLTVRVRTSATDNTEDEHHSQAAEVMNQMTTDEIAADLSSALADFTCFSIVPTAQRWIIDGDVWESDIDFEACCVGSDIA